MTGSTDNRTNEVPNGLASVIKQGIVNYMKDVHTCLPGKIIEFNPALQTTKVQPMIKRVFVGDNEVDLPQLINVPVWLPRAGGFCVTFPIKPDDECLILFSERSLDNWLKTGEAKKPNDYRLHSLSDAICLVGMASEPKVIQNYDPDNWQVRNEEKDVYITLHKNDNKNIDIVTGTVSIVMDNAAETITATAPTKIILDSPLTEITGNLNVKQNADIDVDLNVDGATTLSSTVTSNGKDISDTHKHSGVTSGGSNTGNPV